MAGRRYYRVGPAIWLEDWNDDARYVAFYVLTCDHRTTEGYFRLPTAYAVADLGWQPERFAEAFGQLQADGFVSYDPATSVCLIHKAMEWQSPENPNQVKAAVKAVAKVPFCPLFVTFFELAEQHCERFAEALREAFPQRFPEGFAEPPSPSPPPSRITPPNPPQAGGTLEAPDRPKGTRGRDLKDYHAAIAAWTYQNFPGCDPQSIEQLVGFVRHEHLSATPDAVREFAESHANFRHLLNPEEVAA